MPDDPLDSLKATLGEHYENYVVVVADTRHQCRVIYDNSFAAKGLAPVISCLSKHTDLSALELTTWTPRPFNFSLNPQGILPGK